MGSSRARRVGNQYERDTVNKLKNTGFFNHVGSSRLLSRAFDNAKIDICNDALATSERLKYNIQCKCYKGNIDYKKVLDELPKNNEEHISIIFHKRTEKRGTRFFTVGNYAFLEEESILRMMTAIERYKQGFELLNEYFDSVDSEFQPELDSKLRDLGL